MGCREHVVLMARWIIWILYSVFQWSDKYDLIIWNINIAHDDIAQWSLVHDWSLCIRWDLMSLSVLHNSSAALLFPLMFLSLCFHCTDPSSSLCCWYRAGDLWCTGEQTVNYNLPSHRQRNTHTRMLQESNGTNGDPAAVIPISKIPFLEEWINKKHIV